MLMALCISVAEEFAGLHKHCKVSELSGRHKCNSHQYKKHARQKAQCISQPRNAQYSMVKINLILIHFVLVWLLNIIGRQKETNFNNKRLCKLCDTTHQSNASMDASGRASIKSVFFLLEVFFEQSVHNSTFSDTAWLQRVDSTRQLVGVAVQNLLTRIAHMRLKN